MGAGMGYKHPTDLLRVIEISWGGRWEEGSGWGTWVHPWRMHVDVWQNQYNIAKLKKKKRMEITEEKFNKLNSITGAK